MKIAIIGTGNVGSALGRAFGGLGHAVTFGARDPDDPDVRELARRTAAAVAKPVEAARGAELIVLAVPGGAAEAAARDLGDLGGAVLLDTSNPVGAELLPAWGTDGASLGERVARAARGARTVKGFHTLGAELMGNGRIAGTASALFIAGDDDDAKRVVAELASALGFEPVDLGGIERARLTEAIALTWINLAFRRGQGRAFTFGLLRREATVG